ncbi:PTS sugar transporter subunit IIC [Oceanivirga salmonicida]|uniref:PTS sugar transporter subunit IIC n=1 Tax=Oceanivirga salmonicida TaxID=1769291 RepID=UPI0008335B79|nr:PTS transporter subunit EIIC [Oceanivirga salmonicida]
MNSFKDTIIPIFTKISNQKHVNAVKETFIALAPILLVGSIALLLRDFLIFNFIKDFNNAISFICLSFISIIFIIILAYKLSDIQGLIISLVIFILSIQEKMSINISDLGSKNIFLAIVITIISVELYTEISKLKFNVNMPSFIPPAVVGTFALIIKMSITIYILGIIVYLLPIKHIFYSLIQSPILKFSQNMLIIALMSILIQIFWFFGVHGHNLISPILDTVYQPALISNMEHIVNGGSVDSLPYIWTRSSFDAYQPGGSGITIALIIAIMLFSRKKSNKDIAKMAAPMGIFNINEPIIFGIPLVLNMNYLIPFILAPTISAIIAYIVTVIGIIPPTYIQVPWVLPPGVYAYFATGGSIKAALVAIFNVILSIIIWIPFVIRENRIGENND